MAKYIGAKEDEVFLGNTNEPETSENMKRLKTLRYGDDALDIHGRPLRGYRAIFINQSESGTYETIMMQRFRKACNR